ncbi:Zn-dependent exopeptidase [Auriculariales sp. MPI-PUGE-AT-0066]|nr:Zn-dependent exopeptidase [Auriculariales sp. MPI-PUGE-AT-0066]
MLGASIINIALALAAATHVQADLRLVRYGPKPDDVATVPIEALEAIHGPDGHHDISALDNFPDLNAGFVEAMTNHKRGPGFLDLTGLDPIPGPSEAARFAATYPTPNATAHPNLATYFTQISVSSLTSTITTLASYTTRYYKSTNARAPALWVYNSFVSLLGSSSVTLFENTPSFNQPNVIARIEGSNSSLSNEPIIIGAHLDSINQRSPTSGTAPGADDDASGIAVLLEVARILGAAGWKGSRPIELMAYAGEEGGMLGSANIAASYSSKGIAVRAALQFDMIGYQKQSKPVLTVLGDTGGTALIAFSHSLLTAYVPEGTQYDNACGYACSDNFSWDNYGYAAVSIDESGPNDSFLNPYYHTTSDTLSQMNVTKMASFVKLALAWAVELAE